MCMSPNTYIYVWFYICIAYRGIKTTTTMCVLDLGVNQDDVQEDAYSESFK